MELHLLCGVPGCGKSTLAESLSGYVISTDQLRKFLCGDEAIFKHDKLVFQLLETITKYMVSNKQNVIIDATNITIKSRKIFIDIAKEHGAKVIVHWIDCPLAKAKERNSNRERHVPEVVISSMYKSFQPPTTQEGIDIINIYKADLVMDSVLEASKN